jgi:hypothetical protein
MAVGYCKKTWTERMNNGKEPELRIMTMAYREVPAGSRMLVSTPVMVDNAIRNIPFGTKMEVAALRNAIAASHGADHLCPVSFGLNLRIVAESAYEQWQRGVPAANVTPVWRVIDPSGPFARKCSFPLSFLTDHRKQEDICH